MASVLQDLRKAAGYKTAKEFAAELNIPATTYGRYEANPKKIPLSSAWIIADALDCAIDAVVGRSEPDPETQRGKVQVFYDGLSSKNRALMDEFISFVKLRDEAEQRRRENNKRRYYENLATHYQRMFLQELEDTQEFGKFVGYDTPEHERAAFLRFVSKLAEKKRDKEISKEDRDGIFEISFHSCASINHGNGTEEPIFSDNPRFDELIKDMTQQERERYRKKLEKRDEEVIDNIMAAYDRLYGNVTHALFILDDSASFIEHDSNDQ